MHTHTASESSRIRNCVKARPGGAVHLRFHHAHEAPGNRRSRDLHDCLATFSKGRLVASTQMGTSMRSHSRTQDPTHTHTHADVANMDMGQVLPGLWGSRLGSRRLPASAGNIPPVHPWKAGQGFRQRTSIWIHLAHEFFCKFNWTHFSLANCVLSFWMCSRRGYNIYIYCIYIYIHI